MAVTHAKGVWRKAGWVALALAVVAVPVLIVTSSLRLVINGDWLYSYGFDRYGIPVRTGIEKPELMRVGSEIQAYFNNNEEFLKIRAVINGVERPLFNEREVLHMRDVKGLVQAVYIWQWGALGYLGAFVLLGVGLRHRGWVTPVLRGLLFGGLATIAALVLLGVGTLVGFSGLFLQFHLLGFSNTLWMLDPRTDYLIRMFPEGFFRDATLLVAGLSLAQAAALGVAPWAVRRWLRRTGRRESRA